MLEEENLEEYPSALAARRGLLSGPVRRRLVRNGLRMLFIVGLVVIVALGAAVALIMHGPTELGVLRSRVEQTLQPGLGPSFVVAVGRTALDADAVLGLVIQVDDI